MHGKLSFLSRTPPSGNRPSRSYLILLPVLLLGWVWFFFSIADDLARPAELAGALLFWPLIPGFHVLAHVPQVPAVMQAAFFLVPSLFLLAYYTPALITVRRFVASSGRTSGQAVFLALLVAAYVATTVGAFLFFDGFPN